MKTRLISTTVKVLLALLICFSVFTMILPLPSNAQDMLQSMPSIAYLHIPILVICETMVAMFIVGLVIIWHLLRLFDKGEAFTHTFANRICWIVGLCIIVNIGIVVVFTLLYLEGGPGPGVSLLLISLFLIISILGAILYLISHIITQAMQLREETALTI